MTTKAQEIGTKIGKAIARDTLANGYLRQWTGLDAQDGDQLVAAGIEADSEEWNQAVEAARLAYAAAISEACEKVYVVRDASGEYLKADGGRTPASNEANEFATHDEAESAMTRATDRVLTRDVE